MLDTVTRWLSQLSIPKDVQTLYPVISAIGDRCSSCVVASAGLNIKAAGNVLAKTGTTPTVAFVDGVLVQKGAATDMPALSGSITANSFNVFAFFMDKAGTVTSAMGTESTTLAGVKFPIIPVKSAVLGFLIVTHSSTFVGNTTPLDTATTVYVSPTGAFDPTIILG